MTIPGDQQETTYRGDNMKCPICNATVVKVVESDQDVESQVKCINEYGRHYQNVYEKFITPRTSPDHIRFAH